MNKYLKSFLIRGFAFSGLGPIVLGIVYAVLSNTLTNFSLSGEQVCLGILSTYILVFLQAGATIFNQIDEWPVAKSLLCHFLTIYIAYLLCYLINTWIPFEPMILLIFTVIFVVLYFVIWLIVYISIKSISKKINSKLS